MENYIFLSKTMITIALNTYLSIKRHTTHCACHVQYQGTMIGI